MVYDPSRARGPALRQSVALWRDWWVVEAYETFVGHEPGKPVKRAYRPKMRVLSLVGRETRQVRSMVADDLKVSTIEPILRENIAKEAPL